MKRSKKLIALGLVLALACAATFALTRYEEKQEQIQQSDAVILEIPAESVQTLSWEYEEGGLAFHRGEAGWLYDEDEAFPVNDETVTDILSHFESFGVRFVIENVEDYGQYGLDEPECVIHLGTDEQSYAIRLGAFSKMDSQRYVDIGDGNVYLVSDDPMELLESELSGMIEHDSTPYFETVTEIRFQGSESYRIVRTEDSPNTYSDEDVYFAELDGVELPLDTDRVGDYLDTVTGLELVDYVTYNATETELEDFGLAEPELSVTIDYTYTDAEEQECSDTCVLHIGRNAEEQAAYEAAVKAAEESEAAGEEPEALPTVSRYVRVGESQIVYALDEADYAALTAAAYDDLRHREVIWADADTITQLDITLEGETHSLISTLDTEDEDAVRVWYCGEEEVDVDGVKDALAALSAERFTDETPAEKEEIRLTVYLDNENFPQVEIALYRYDGSLCLAVVDGQSVAFVDRASVVELIERVQAIVLGQAQTEEAE